MIRRTEISASCFVYITRFRSKSMYLDCIELFLIHLFWDFPTYPFSFETNTALKAAISSSARRARFRVTILKQLAPVDLRPQSASENALVQTAQGQKHLVNVTAHIESIIIWCKGGFFGTFFVFVFCCWFFVCLFCFLFCFCFFVVFFFVVVAQMNFAMTVSSHNTTIASITRQDSEAHE